MAVKTFSKSADTSEKLSTHFKVKEFACKDGDKILIDTILVDKLESLRTKLGCTKMIINSGYRTPAHDKAVGGSGKGQHTKGKAADVVCYNADGKISAKLVCCAAESLGFAGIGYMPANSIHLDVRSGARWWGDETKGNKSISKINGSQSFYDYFGIKKLAVCPYKEPTVNIKRGSKGEGVKWVQWHLNAKGYNCGKIDGICGKNTAKQISYFQQDNGLAVDGVCGNNTRTALKGNE